MRSRAIIFLEPGLVEVGEVISPDPGSADVVVSLQHSWVSTGTERSVLHGERIGGDTPRHDGDPWPFPIVPGYQKVGTVEWVGAEVNDLGVGDTVFAAMSRVSGMFLPFGGHVSPSVVPRSQVWRIPPETSQNALAFAGLVLTQVGYNCAARPPVEEGDVAIVIGDGLVGQWTAQALAWRGAEVVLLGHDDERLDKLPPAPRRHVLNTTTVGAYPWIREKFPNGATLLVDTAGDIGTVGHLSACLQRFGHIVSAGFYGVEDRLALQPLRDAELSIHLVSGWTDHRVNATLELIAGGDLKTLPLITHRFPIANAVEAWEMIMSRSESFLGVVFNWE